MSARAEAPVAPVPSGGGGTSWRFEATPPRRSPSALQGRQDTRTVTVRVRNAGDRAEIWVGDTLASRASRITLRGWLRQRGPKPDLKAGRLILRYSDMGIWFEVETLTAPTVLSQAAITSIVNVLT